MSAYLVGTMQYLSSEDTGVSMMEIGALAKDAPSDVGRVIEAALGECMYPQPLTSENLIRVVAADYSSAEDAIAILRAEAKDIKMTADGNALVMFNDANPYGIVAWALAREIAVALKHIKLQQSVFKDELENL